MGSKYKVCCAHDIRTDENRQKSLPACREREIEKYFVQQVKKNGGLAPKFVSPGWDGVPDRLVLLLDGRMAFVELKAPGKKLRPLQVKRKRQLEKLGFRVYLIDGQEQIGGVLDEIRST